MLLNEIKNIPIKYIQMNFPHTLALKFVIILRKYMTLRKEKNHKP